MTNLFCGRNCQNCSQTYGAFSLFSSRSTGSLPLFVWYIETCCQVPTYTVAAHTPHPEAGSRTSYINPSRSGLVINRISRLLRKSDFFRFEFILVTTLGITGEINKRACTQTSPTAYSSCTATPPARPRASTLPNCTYTKLANHNRKPHGYTSRLLPQCRPQSRRGRGISPWGPTKK